MVDIKATYTLTFSVDEADRSAIEKKIATHLRILTESMTREDRLRNVIFDQHIHKVETYAPDPKQQAREDLARSLAAVIEIALRLK